MLKNIFRAILLIMLFGALPACGSEPVIYNLTVHQLVSDPEKYRGERIELRGYFKPGLGLLLFASKEDANINNYPASILIDLWKKENLKDIDKCLNKHIIVIGTLGKAKNPYASGRLSITDVEFLKVITRAGTDFSLSDKPGIYCVGGPIDHNEKLNKLQ